MKKIVLITLMFFGLLTAQTNQNDVLFTVDNNPITIKEFERVYTKNNINNQADYSRKSLEEYLNLYINFKLKVKEAEQQQLDTIPSINKELQTYQSQLVKSYAKDKVATAELIQEAYNRSLEEIECSHILVVFKTPYPSAKDSAEALKAIKEIQNRTTPKNFNEIAKALSQDPSAKDNSGYLGYITVFQTVYPFENAMYNTPAGTVSNPFPTQFGYHLVYVQNKRKAEGAMQTAHILIKSKNTDSAAEQEAAKLKAEQMYKDILQGNITFEDAAGKSSDDTKSKFNGGQLPWLKPSEMLPAYYDAAYTLKNDGNISKPVKTEIGWHIIKRIAIKDIPTFEEAKPDLENKVSRDMRSIVADEKNTQSSKQQFGFSSNKQAIDGVVNDLANTYSNNSFAIDKNNYKQDLFVIGNTSYNQQDFIDYAQQNYRASNASLDEIKYKLHKLYNNFETIRIQDYKEMNLALVNEDYKNLMQEYHDGILLFDLTDREVWSKAVEDTVGLKAYFEKHRDNYMWGNSVVYKTYTFTNDAAAALGIKLLKKGKSSQTVLSKLNKTEKQAFEKETKTELETFNVEGLEPVLGSSKENKLANGQTQYLVVTKLLQAMPKELNETRGYVISDYQNHLEQEWIKNLRTKYPVVVNEQVFNSLIKK